MDHFAQTNIQLFNQMYDHGYGNQDVADVNKTYELVMALFTGCFRGSGKPFIAHLVGTSSILVSLCQTPIIISAGLLHAAYDVGDFGIREAGITPAKRDHVKNAVGEDVERYVAGYTEFKWSSNKAGDVFQNLDTFNQFEKEVLLIRLANELEDYLDFGILYCGSEKHTQVGLCRDTEQLIGNVARKMGFSMFAETFEYQVKETHLAMRQRPFDLGTSRNFSFTLLPLSQKRVMDLLSARLNMSDKKDKKKLRG